MKSDFEKGGGHKNRERAVPDPSLTFLHSDLQFYYEEVKGKLHGSPWHLGLASLNNIKFCLEYLYNSAEKKSSGP